MLPALAVALLAASVAPPASADRCVAPPVAHRLPFGYGERLEFALDSLGATIGSLRLSVVPGPPDHPLEVEARGETGTFAANFFAVNAVARSEFDRKLLNVVYSEDSTEKGIHRTFDVRFPPVSGRLDVRASEEGRRRDYRLRAPPATVDLLAALYAVRAMPLTNGEELCLPVFAGHRIWTVRAKVVGREKAHTPAGDFDTIHLAGTAERLDSAKTRRDLQFWISDDKSRLPVAACGSFQGKPVCANLTSMVRGHVAR